MISFLSGMLAAAGALMLALLILWRRGKLCTWGWIDHDWRVVNRAQHVKPAPGAGTGGGDTVRHTCPRCGCGRIATLPPVKRGHTVHRRQTGESA